MVDAHETLNLAIEEITRARNVVMRQRSRQIRSQEEKQYLQSIVYSWKKTHYPIISQNTSQENLSQVEKQYAIILEATGKNASKATYLIALRDAKTALIKLRSDIFIAPLNVALPRTLDAAPNFTSLVANKEMKDILIRRWEECKKCLNADANLAATVMMGGLLEALFVAKANKMPNKSPLFKAKNAPKDQKTKKPLPLKEWTLNSYIEVGYELKWIRKSGRDIASILKEYRNYVHPEKELSHGITLNQTDSTMFWEITKLLTRQLLNVP